MTLESGIRLGPYEILAPIGAGGMGEVYKARDTRLDRTVAIKVLPEHLAESPERKARFEREAKAISQLNHPNICTLYDVHLRQGYGGQVGVEDGDPDYLVMEYIEGETLADRLKKGRLKLDQALEVGIQIAGGLDKAHRAGIVHRDLKPGNIMLTKSGVKLLDFGLAKLVEAEPMPAEESDASTQEKDLTQAHAVVGTPRYMAPEQLEGRRADPRADVFALGTVLYEMVSGRRAFDADSHARLAAAILTETPTPLDVETPPALKRLIEKCLEKDADTRWQNALDLKTELEWIRLPANTPPSTPQRASSWLLVAAASILAGGAAWWFASASAPLRDTAYRLSVVLPSDVVLERGESPVLSPDGQTLAFVAADVSGGSRLWIRGLREAGAQALPGTEGAAFPFWSPDSRQLAFTSGGYLKRLDLISGETVNVCPTAGTRGGTWNARNVILFAPVTGPLQRVSAEGGEATTLTSLDLERGEWSHRSPSFLPDGRRFFYSVLSTTNEGRVAAVGSLDTDEVVYLNEISASKVLYAETGFVAFIRGDTLMAQRFDVERLSLEGEPFALASSVELSIYAISEASFSMARDGTLVYRSSTNRGNLMWFDRQGRVVSTTGPPGRYIGVSLALDDRSIAVTQRDDQSATEDIWLVEREQGAPTRLTVADSVSNNVGAIWLQGSDTVAYTSIRAGLASAVVRRHRARPGSEVLLEFSGIAFPDDVTPDGKHLVFTDYTHGDLGRWSLEEPNRTEPLLDSQFIEKQGALSPDGRWLAYTSNETGADEVYVQSFPELGTKYRLSSGGGHRPSWRRDGKEVYYLEVGHRGDRLMAIDVEKTSASALTFGTPRELFETPTIRHPLTPNYAAANDGTRFLFITPNEPDMGRPYFDVLLGWANGTDGVVSKE